MVDLGDIHGVEVRLNSFTFHTSSHTTHMRHTTLFDQDHYGLFRSIAWFRINRYGRPIPHLGDEDTWTILYIPPRHPHTSYPHHRRAVPLGSTSVIHGVLPTRARRQHGVIIGTHCAIYGFVRVMFSVVGRRGGIGVAGFIPYAIHEATSSE